MRGLFVTGTDTGVGKTIVSAALLAAMAAAGERVRAHKPVVTGLEDPAEIAARGRWPADHELLAAAASMSPEDVAPLRYGPAVSPHLAAELAGERIDPGRLLAAARAGDGQETVVVEGVGGLLTPLAEDYSVCDLAVALGLPVLVVARAGLGTINHTLLTLHVARAAGLQVRAVVLNALAGAADGSPPLKPFHDRPPRRGAGGEASSGVGPGRGSLAQAGSPLVRALLER